MSEYVWFDSQGEGLTQDEVESLGNVALYNPEIEERAQENKKINFLQWLKEHGKFVRPDDPSDPA
jgi:hypothetical protein